MSLNFGSTPFGTNTSAGPSFNFGSCAPATTQAASSAFSFGSTPATTASSGFGFGSITPATGFGGSATPAPAFGTATASSTGFGTSSSTGFGSSSGSSFGTGTCTTPAFNFSTPASTSQSLFSGFGQTQTTTGFSGFGSKAFGTATTQSSFGFGGTGTGSLGQSTFTTSGFGQGAQTQQQQAVPQNSNEALLTSLYRCNIFGDERDQIIGNWNLLQAFWGFGKGYYAQNAPPFQYTPQVMLCGLNTVGYSVKSKISSADALIAISINKKPDEIRNQQIQFESGIASLLGNKPNVTVHVDRVNSMPDNKSLILIYVQEKQPTGVTKRIPNADICTYMLQPMQKQQLINLGVDNIYPFLPPNESQLTDYLEIPPPGIDARLWKQAQLENPDKQKFIPVPILGFSGVLWRVKCQEEQMKLHDVLLDTISENVSSMQRIQISTNVKLGELKQKTLELEHRVLKLIVKVSRSGTENTLPFGPEEERMKSRLEALEAAFNKPQGIKDRLSQIITSLRMHDVSNEKRYECDVDDNMIGDLKEFLASEQKAIRELKEVLQSDITDMKIMGEEMKKFQVADS